MRYRPLILPFVVLLSLMLLISPDQAHSAEAWSLQILESDRSHLLLELQIPTFAAETILQDGVSYQRLSVGDGWGRWGRPGQPQLPAYSLPVGLPGSEMPEISVLEAETERLPGYTIYPNPDFATRGAEESAEVVEVFQRDPAVYEMDTDLPGNLVEASPRSFIREQALFRLRFYPFQYNPGRQELSVARRLKVLVTFPESSLSALALESSAPPPDFRSILEHTLINYKTLPLASNANTSPPLSLSQLPQQGLFTKTGAEYVIITHPNFYNTIQNLANYRAASGLSVVVVKTDDIYSQYSSGQKKPEAIRDYLANAYQTWSVKPVYVLLVGDGDANAVVTETDAKGNKIITGYQDVATDFVPSHHELLLFGPAPLDIWYTKVTQVSGVYDDDPDLVIGRIPARSTSDVNAVFNKIQNYEQQPMPLGNWTRKAVLVADNGSSSFSNDMETLADLLPANITPIKIYGPDLNVETEIDNGALLVAYSGHGSRTRWGSWTEKAPYFYEKNQIRNMSNNNQYPFVTVANCSNGYFSYPGTPRVMAEEFLLLADKGSIASWAAASSSFPSVNTPMSKALYEALFVDDNLTLGAAAVTALVEAYAENWYLDRNLFESFTYFGDPAVRLALPIDDPPLANFTSSSPDKLGQLTTFTNYSTGQGNNYLWDFGDGATSIQKSPSHTYSAIGDYTVSLMVTNALGSDSTTTQVRILPADAQITAPVASFYHNGPTQLGQKTTFVNTSQDGGDTNENVQYDWKFDDGVSSISINPAHLYSMPGTYTVQLRVTNSVGMDTFSDTVEVIDPTTTTGETFIFLPLIIK